MDKPLQDSIPLRDSIYEGHGESEYPMPSSAPMLNQEAGSFIKLPQCDTTLKVASSKRKCCSLSKTVKTIAAYGTYIGVGMLMSILGSSLLDLGNNTDASSNQMALLFTWQNLGRLPGVLLSGILAERFNKEAQIGLCMLALAAVATSFPFCTNYGVLATVVALSGSGLGFIGGGTTYYIMSLWDAPSALLGLHLCMSVGYTIGPLVSKPFQEHHAHINSSNFNGTNVTFHNMSLSNINIRTSQSVTELPFMIEDNSSSILSNISQGNLSVNVFQFDDKPKNYSLAYPYLIMGIFDVIVASLFLVLFAISFQRRQDDIKKADEARKDIKKQVEIGRARRLVILTLYCIFLFFSGGAEVAYGGLVVVYAYKTLKFAKTTSTVVNAAFFGAICASRIFGIIITKFGYLRVNIGISITLGVVGMVGLSAMATLHVSIIWICSVFIGIALSQTVGNVLVLTKKTLRGSSHTTSALMFSIYLGMMLVPAALGTMFKLWGTYIFPYTMLACVSMMVILFATSVLVYNGKTK